MKRNKEILADYWDKKIPIHVPDDSIVASVTHPPPLPDPLDAVQKALMNPIGAPPLQELAQKAKGGKVIIAHDDPNRPGIPRRVIIDAVLDILNGAGIPDDHVYLLSAGGTHPKWPDSAFRAYYGEEIYSRFKSIGSTSRILNHDCHDPDSLVYMGASALGDYVECNRLLAEADLVIYLGTVASSNWGGYTGTGAAIGLLSARGVLSTHNFDMVNHPESCHGDPRTMLYRKHKQAVMAHIENTTGRRVFYVDIVLGQEAQMSAVFAGYSPEINEPAWEFCDHHYLVEVPQADVFIMGLPGLVVYGQTSNPIVSLALVATPPRIWRNRPILREGGVVIALVRCNGYIDPRAYPSAGEVMNLYRGLQFDRRSDAIRGGIPQPGRLDIQVSIRPRVFPDAPFLAAIRKPVHAGPGFEDHLSGDPRFRGPQCAPYRRRGRRSGGGQGLGMCPC